MRRKLIISSILFYAASLTILFFYSSSFDIYLNNVYNADILFPFSLYRGLFNATSHSDWVFGGYTPFVEILVGLVLWVLTRDIHATFLLYAVIQPILLTLSLVLLANRILGRNAKAAALVIVFSALPIYLFAFGRFDSAWMLFAWYLHITTLCFTAAALGLLIQLVSAASLNRSSLPSFIGLILLILTASMSDALFIAQFTIPTVITLVLFIILKLVPFRRGSYLGLTVLYSTAAGLALYRLPSLWGSDRLVFYGSYIRPSLELIVENISSIVKLIPSAWDGSLWGSMLWILFYGLCLTQVLMTVKPIQQSRSGIRGKLMMACAFFIVQMIVNISSGLVSLTPGTRYFLPSIFIPLFWGWPFLLLARPAWIKQFRSPKKSILYAAPLALAALALLSTSLAGAAGPGIRSKEIKLVECLDQKAAQFELKRGMANYWQARPVSLLSKTGLEVVQVDPELQPFRILNNSDGYADDFDFVIISNNFEPGHWMDRDIVINKFGLPSAAFFCEQSEILVYSRGTDAQINNPFDSLLSSQD